jgi:hypothetical protein
MAESSAAHGRMLVLLFLPARSFFALLGQLIATAIAALAGSDDPWRAAAGWWMVYGTVADLLCIAALFWLTRRESRTIASLLYTGPGTPLRQLLWSPLYLLGVGAAIVLAGAFTWLFYRSGNPPQVALVHLPMAAAVYAVVIWPALWAFTEETTYLGYLFPRLAKIVGSTVGAALLVTIFWALQHAFLPFIPDVTYLVSRVGAALIVAVGTIAIFLLGKRRLAPLIVVHWIADVAAAATAVSWL